MQIGAVAKKAEIPVQTIRFYERQGLLPNPPRKESGYRLYGEADLKRLRFIRQAKELGFSLKEIREILHMRDCGKCPSRNVLRLAEQHLETTRNQLRRLSAFRDELRRAIKHWKGLGRQRLSADAFCVLIENTMSDGSLQGRMKNRRTA